MENRTTRSILLVVIVYLLMAGQQLLAYQCEEGFLPGAFHGFRFQNLVESNFSRNAIVNSPSQAKLRVVTKFAHGVSKLSDLQLKELLEGQIEHWLSTQGYLPGLSGADSDPKNLDDLIKSSIVRRNGKANDDFVNIYAQFLTSITLYSQLYDDHIQKHVPISPRNLDFLEQYIETLYASLLLEEIKRRLRDGRWTEFDSPRLLEIYRSFSPGVDNQNTHWQKDYDIEAMLLNE